MLTALLPFAGLFAQPTITSFEPLTGPVGTSVTITGTGFDMDPANNVVFFGATQAVVSEANTTSLIAIVPFGATYKPLTVLVNGLMEYTSDPFIVTFDGGGTIDAGSFRTKLELESGDTPWAISSGDLDGDGKPELVVVNSASNTLSIYMNTSSEAGVISYDTKVDYTTGADPFSVAIGDLDGDGKPDLAVGNTGDNTVSVYRNTSSGSGAISYASKIDFPTGSFPISVAIGDIDADGKSDLALTNYNDNSVSILRNTSTVSGAISYDEEVNFPTGKEPISVAIGDLDGDGKSDLAIANFGGTELSILSNTGPASGVISYATKVDLAAGNKPRWVAIGDLDGDGKSDLATVNSYGASISIFRNTNTETGVLSYDTKVDYASGIGPVSIEIADLDGDSKPDLAVTNNGSNSVSVFHNTSSGSGAIDFAAKVDYDTDEQPWSVALGDLDSDGRSELMVANYARNSILILENSIGSTTSSAPSISTSGEDGILVYPNPFEDQISFDFTSNNYSNIEIEIYDVMGRIVLSSIHQRVLEKEKISLDMTGLNDSEIYFYMIHSNGEQRDAGRIIKR